MPRILRLHKIRLVMTMRVAPEITGGIPNSFTLIRIIPPHDFQESILVGGPSFCAQPTTGTGFVDGYKLTVSVDPASGNITSEVVTDPSGNVHDLLAGTLTDPNGNSISTTTSNQPGVPWTLTDTTGNVALKELPGTSSLTYYYPSPNGGVTEPVVFTLTTFTLNTNFQCPTVADITGTSYPAGDVSLVTSIGLPDQTSYQIVYESTNGTYPSTVTTGRIHSLTLPSGATITYTYSGGNNGINCQDGSPATLTKQTPDGTWIYNHYFTQTAQFAGLWTTVVTDPAGNDTVYTFGSDPTTQVPQTNSLEVQRQIYQGSRTSGTLLKTLITCYNGNFTNCETSTKPEGPASIAGMRKDVYTYLPGVSQPSLSETFYQAGIPYLINEDNEFDFGVNTGGSPTVNPLKSTLITYASLSNNIQTRPSCIQINAGPAPSSCGVVNAVTNSITQYSNYDAQGNVGLVQNWVYGGYYLSRNFTYFSNGLVNTATDFRQTPTTYTYGDCNGSYPTKVTTAGLSQSFTWDCNGGVLLSSTDENLQQTLYSYIDTTTNVGDPFWRRTQTSYPDQGQTQTHYHDTDNPPNTVTTELINNSGAALATQTNFDPLGRPVLQLVTSDPNGTLYKQTTYDPLGRTKRVYNPTHCDPSISGCIETTWGYTEYAYDALGRVTQVTNPDGTTALSSYTGRAAKVQDEGNGTQRVARVLQTDALGRTTAVCEVASSGGTPSDCGLDTAASGFLTNYSYDALGNLTYVAQAGLNPRQFLYDGLSRLTNASNPESNGTVYLYDSDSNCPTPNSFAGELVSKLDARGVRMCVQYDSLHHIVQKNYSDGTPTVTYNYGEPSAMGVSLQYTAGRKSSESTAGPYPTGAVFSYDKMGRVLDNSQCTPLNCGATPYPVTYLYDYVGNVTSASDGVAPSPFTIGYTFDAANHLRQVTSTWNTDSLHPSTLYSSQPWSPIGVTDATLGTSITLHRDYDVRTRLYQESDQGTIVDPATSGSASTTIQFAEQTKGVTPGTGSISISGPGEQSTVKYVYATGSVTINGTLQSSMQGPQPAAGSVDITGTERKSGSHYDTGTVTITINGFSETYTYGSSDTQPTIGKGLANQFNGASSSPVTASFVQNVGKGTIYFTSKAAGSGTNYPLSVTSATTSPYFTGTSFPVSPSGSSLTGGIDSEVTYDSGSTVITVGNPVCNITSTWSGSSTTAASIASDLAQRINSGSCDGGTFPPVTATTSGGTVYLTAVNGGTSGNVPLDTYTSSADGSFFSTASGSTLTGGQTNTVYDSGTVVVTVNGYSESALFNQNSTASGIASSLASAFTNDPLAPVTATASNTTVSFTSRQLGGNTNYSLSSSVSYDSADFSQPSFTASTSGPTLTGGTSVSDSGSVTMSVSSSPAFSKIVAYGMADTPATIAANLASAYSGDSNSPVNVSSSGGTVTITAKQTGAATNYGVSFAETHDTADFSSPSFGGPAEISLAGGRDPSSSPGELYAYTLSFMPNGNVSGMSDSVLGTWSYGPSGTPGYDDLNRLIYATSTAGPCNGINISWTYDQLGNRRTQSASGTTSCTIGQPTLSYSGSNNRIDGWQYDLAGNVTNDGIHQYTYDGEGRLSTVDGATKYVYDAEGHRVAKVQVGGGVISSYVVGPNGEQAAELNGSSQWIHSNIYAEGRLLATYNSSGTHFQLSDALGSRRVQADANGTSEGTYFNYPFGDGLLTNGADATEHHFTDKERDAESNLDNFGFRYYGSSMGRFMSPDEPFYDGDQRDPQKLNLYSYVRNNPLNSIDPDGHLVVICTNDEDGKQKCTTVSDRDYYNAVNKGNNPGINAPKWGQSGDITCGGVVCGHATYMDEGAVNPLGEQYLGGWAFGSGIGRAIGGIWSGISGWFGRGAGETAGEVGGAAGATAGKATVQDILQGAVDEGGSRAQIFSKPGGFAQATKDFEALEGQSQNLGRVQVKDLPNGQGRAVLRNFSSDGRPTLEIQPAGGGYKSVAIRYNP